jgi:acidic leucine-rich nuclear phosphoprotein 32 family protein B
MSLEDCIRRESGGRDPEDVERLCLDQASCKEGLAPLAPFKNLVSLSVQFAGLTALDTLPPLPNCNTLKLSDNKIKGGLDKLKDLPELEKLYLAANQIATLEALAPLAGLKKLAWVDLEGNPVNKVAGYRDSMFELLPNLVVLDGRNADGDDVDEQDEDDEDEDEDDEDDEGEEEGEGEDDDDEEEEEEEDDEGRCHIHLKVLGVLSPLTLLSYQDISSP